MIFIEAWMDDQTDREVATSMALGIEDTINPEMKNLGLEDGATSGEKLNGVTNWSSPRGEPYKNASIDFDTDGYKVEVYASANEEDQHETIVSNTMDAVKFIRGLLSPQGAVAPAPGEDPTQAELPLQENRKIKIRRKKK